MTKPDWLISKEALGMIIQTLVEEHLSYEEIGRLIPKLSRMLKDD